MVPNNDRRHATRFPLQVSLLFRPRSAARWSEGSTLNMSHLGVLFRTDGPLPAAGEQVEFVVALPLNGEASPTKVWCTGSVARREQQRTGGSVAVTIDRYVLEGRASSPATDLSAQLWGLKGPQASDPSQE